MKNLKVLSVLMIIAVTFLSVTMSRQASADPYTTKPIYLNYNQAMQVPDLADEMHEQLSDEFLMRNNQAYYTVSIFYENFTVFITGTYEQWRSFFSSGTEIGVEQTKKTNLR